jgi:hypothetical protein
MIKEKKEYNAPQMRVVEVKHQKNLMEGSPVVDYPDQAG